MRHTFFIAIIILLTFLACNKKLTQKSDHALRITGEKITQIFPRIYNDGKLIGYDTISNFIFTNGKQLMYRSSYEILNLDSLGNIKSSKFAYRSLIYSKNHEKGLLYDPNQLDSLLIVSVDSFLKLDWTSRIQVYEIFLKNKVQLIDSKNSTSSTLEEVYSLKGISDTSMNGTILLSYSTRNPPPKFVLSLSHELDSIKKMPLIKVRIMNSPRYLTASGIHIDAVQTGYEIEKIETNSLYNLAALFNKEKRLNLE